MQIEFVLEFLQLKSKVNLFNSSNLSTTVPFGSGDLEIFHFTHHPVIPVSNSYFILCSVLSKSTSQYTIL